MAALWDLPLGLDPLAGVLAESGLLGSPRQPRVGHGAPRQASWSPSCSPFWALTPPSLGLSPLPPPRRDPVTHLLSLSPSLPHPFLPPSISISSLSSGPHRPSLPAHPTSPPRVLTTPHLSPSPFPSYFLAVTSQRHPDVRPQITSRDLGFRSEVLYFCTTGWAPSSRWRTCSSHCLLCLHLSPCWALGPLGRAACLWPKRGAVQLCLPGPCVPSPETSCMADTIPPGPVTSPP